VVAHAYWLTIPIADRKIVVEEKWNPGLLSGKNG
jgi:hypothetical protein